MPNIHDFTELTERAVSATGSAREARTALQDCSGVFQTLKNEHAEISELMIGIAAAADADVARQLFPRLRVELLSHFRAEDFEFYSLLRQHSTTLEWALHSMDEHREIEERLDVLYAHDPSNVEPWLANFRSLMDAVHGHIREEEEQIFRRARHVISNQAAEDIDRRYSKRRIVELEQLVAERATH